MFENLNDINLDPTVRPSKNRLVKLAGIPLALLSIALAVYLLTRIDVFPSAVTVVNVCGVTLDEYCEVSRVLSDHEGVAAIELNISCPNIKEGGI